MPITLSGTRITVEYQAGDPKGNSWNDPFTMTDVYDASVAGGWSPGVQKLGTTFFLPYSLYIQGSNTYFQIAGEKLEWDSEETYDDIYLFYTTSGNVRILHNSDTYMSSILSGLNTKRLYIVNNNVEVQNTIFDGFGRIYLYNCILTNVVLHAVKFKILNGCSVDTLFCVNDGYDNGIQPAGNFASASNITIKDVDYALLLYAINFDVSNLKIINVKKNDLYIWPNYGRSNTLNFTDSQLDMSSRKVLTSNQGDMTFNNISTFKINITDGDGGVAKLYDKNDDLVFSETLSGELTKVVIFEKLYVETNYELVADDFTSYEPFKLVVEKEGYADLEIPGITVTPGDITEIFGKMEYLPLEISALTFTHCSNEASNDGTITIEAQGGSGNYEYSKDGGTNWQASGSFTELAPGDYDVIARDTETGDEIVAGTITISAEKLYISGIDGDITEETLDGTIEEETLNGEIE